MSDVESDEGPPPHPATYELPDIPFDEMSPLQKRWHKIKAIPEFPVKVVYLGDCEMPLEYVEYLSEDMRKQALEQAATEDIDIGGLEIKESGGKKKSQSRGGRGAVKAKKKTEPQKVKVGRVSRGKKKAVTHVTGLHSYELDLKKTAKIFGSKFACGTSSNEKTDEIVIQGDFIDEVIDLIMDKFGDKIPENMIVDIGDMKKAG